jgi:TolB-like protein/tetratricopeptide (TPR) repeat protein
LFELTLIGPFHLRGPDGCRVNIASKKAQALLALLAMSGSGERTRGWLQSQLWGSRAADQAQASLRNELSSLRALLNSGEHLLIHSDKNRVWLNLSLIRIDAREGDGGALGQDEFLEGLDIAGEDGFEEWLREERARTVGRAHSAKPSPKPPGVAQSQPLASAGFSSLPALAILPFTNLTGDAAQDFLAEGISEDLIDRLSRLRWLPIIARGSSFTFRDANVDLRQVGEALGARYLLDGRLRLQGSEQMLSVSLATAETGQILWSKKLACSSDSSNQALDDLLSGLASVLGSRIEQEEQARTLHRHSSDLSVRELIWRGRWHINRMTKPDSELAKACFDEALALEPNSSEAIIQSVWARVWELWAKRGSDDAIRDMRQMAQKAIIADCDDARGHMLAGIAEIWLHQPLRAEALLRHAIDLNPSLAMAHAQLGSSLRVRDEHEAAIDAFRMAIRLSPNDHDMFFFAGELAASLLMMEDYAEALVQADQAISRRRGYWFPYVVKVNALVRLDRMNEAKRVYGELLAIKSDFTPKFIQWSPFADPKNIAFFEDGLNRAAG